MELGPGGSAARKAAKISNASALRPSNTTLPPLPSHILLSRQWHLASLLQPSTMEALRRQQQQLASHRRHARRRALALADAPQHMGASVQQQLRWQQRPIGSAAPAA